MIKIVPSRVFNSGLDKWILRSMGEVDYEGLIERCSYCEFYNESPCPLGLCDWCCNDLYHKWKRLYLSSKYKQAMKVADKIADYIISRCVYDTNELGE